MKGVPEAFCPRPRDGVAMMTVYECGRFFMHPVVPVDFVVTLTARREGCLALGARGGRRPRRSASAGRTLANANKLLAEAVVVLSPTTTFPST